MSKTHAVVLNRKWTFVLGVEPHLVLELLWKSYICVFGNPLCYQCWYHPPPFFLKKCSWNQHDRIILLALIGNMIHSVSSSLQLGLVLFFLSAICQYTVKDIITELLDQVLYSRGKWEYSKIKVLFIWYLKKNNLLLSRPIPQMRVNHIP